jgi:hypothetical protein
MFVRNRKDETGWRKSRVMTAAEYVPWGMPEKQNSKIYTVIWSPIGNKIVKMCTSKTCSVPRLVKKDYVPRSEQFGAFSPTGNSRSFNFTLKNFTTKKVCTSSNTI